MGDFNWKSVDLNLLIALQAIYQTRSVSLAAQRCHVSQSAMSHSLQRLRKLFDDPLFERVGTKMEPTPRTLELQVIVDDLLWSIQSKVLTKKTFDIQRYDGEWRIGMTDYAEQMFAPRIFDCLKSESPQSKVAFFNVSKSNYQKYFESNQLDIVIGSFGDVSSLYQAELLYTEQHVCLFDSSALKLDFPISIEQFVSVEHALVSPDGLVQTNVDTQLKKLGYSRRVAITSSNFLTVKKLVKGRPLICIVPRLVGLLDGEDESLTTATPPIRVSDFDIKLLCKMSSSCDYKNKVLRQIVSKGVHDVISSLAH